MKIYSGNNKLRFECNDGVIVITFIGFIVFMVLCVILYVINKPKPVISETLTSYQQQLDVIESQLDSFLLKN